MKALLYTCFLLILACFVWAEITYESLPYGVPASVAANEPIYFNTSLHAIPSFLVFYLSTPTSEPYLCASTNPAPNSTNCQYSTIYRSITSTIEVWFDSPQEGQIIYFSVRGIGTVTLSNATNFESITPNSMDLYELDFTIPLNGQVWFEYTASAAYDTYWFYPVICAGNNAGSFFKFVIYPSNLTNVSDGIADCGNGNSLTIQSTQIDLPAGHFNSYLLQEYLCDNTMFNTYVDNSQLGATLYVSFSAYDSRIVGDTVIKLYFWKSNSSASYLPDSFPQNLLLTPVTVYRDLLVNFDSPASMYYLGYQNYSYDVFLFPYTTRSVLPACSILSNPNSTQWPSHKLKFSAVEVVSNRQIASSILFNYKANLPEQFVDENAQMTVIMTLPNGLQFAYLPMWTQPAEPVVSAPFWSSTSLTVLLALALALVLSVIANVIMIYRILSRQSQYVQLNN